MVGNSVGLILRKFNWLFIVSIFFSKDLFKSEEPREVDEKKLQKLGEAFAFLEAFMGDSQYMAGDEITIADYSLVATVSSIEVFPKFFQQFFFYK